MISEWNRLFPHCSVESRCFDSKNAINWFKATFSHTLERVGSSETVLLLLGISLSPSFGIGVTSAIFQSIGNVPDTKDALIIDVSVGAIAGRPSLTTRHLRKRIERKFLSPVLSHTSMVSVRGPGSQWRAEPSTTRIVLRHFSRGTSSSLPTSFIYFIGFVGLCTGLGKAGVAKLRPA